MLEITNYPKGTWSVSRDKVSTNTAHRAVPLPQLSALYGVHDWLWPWEFLQLRYNS